MKMVFLRFLMVFNCMFFFIFFSCSKMDSYKDEFISGKEGEFEYAGRVDSLKVIPGKERLKLKWMIHSDPNINKTIIYWNNRSDSVLLDIRRSPGIDTIEHIIELTEGEYSFEVINFNENGAKSVSSYAVGKSLGEKYQSTLIGNAAVSAVLENGVGVIKWGVFDENSVGIKGFYEDVDDNEIEFFVSPDESTTHLENFKPYSKVSYQTLFLPEKVALDTFYTTMVKDTLIIKPTKLDKSKFKEMSLPGDAPVSTQYPTQVAMKYIWDDVWAESYDAPYNGNGNAYKRVLTDSPNGSDPSWITFDLGVTAQLSEYKIYDYWRYEARAMIEYEIWGSADPGSDGGWDNWTKLVSYTNEKPASEEAKREQWESGHGTTFSEDLPPVRYIRIKSIRTYRTSTHNETDMEFEEITFWGVEL